jgi:fibronectin type 3 domain-containing protein
MKRMTMRSIGTMLLLAFALVGACSKEHDMSKVSNPVDPRATGLTPPVPIDLTAAAGNRHVSLTWVLSADDSSSTSFARLRTYRIYRRRLSEATPVLVDSVSHPPADVQDLLNGQACRFAVSVVLRNGLEGRLSQEITATPGVFGVLIEGGRNAINTSQVTLTLLAPDGTPSVRLSNSADFAGAATTPFATSLAWRLEPGDGVRTVYARFLDPAGNPSELATDQVTVDTRAEIKDVTFSPLSAQPGDRIRFQLDAGEPHGRAYVQLGSGGRQLQLRDDGQEGDATAGDGIYSLSYQSEDDLDLVDGLITGSFSDEAGNVASNRVASARLTVHRNPPAVVLSEIAVLGPKQLYLSWSQASDAGRFAAYRIFRADSAGVDVNPSRRQVAEISNRSQITYTDGSLEPDHVYYYRVYVVDGNGFMTSSNERAASPKRNPPPAAVVLYAPSHVTESVVSLAFSQSLSPDFAHYDLYRGEQADLANDPQRRLLTTIGSAASTSYDDRTEVEEGKTFYYRVDVVDTAGGVAQSNVVSALIPDKPPHAVNLSSSGSPGETTVLLSWNKSADLDFARYDLRRGRAGGVSPDSALVVSLSQAELLSYLDHGLVENTDYAYRIFVVDKGGHVTGSNEISVTTKNADPPAVILSAPLEVTSASRPTVNLSWSASTAHDFQQYLVYRDTSPAVGEASSTLVRSVLDATVTTYTDSDTRLNDNTRYYYRVFVHDTAGGKTGSNEQSLLLRNQAPIPVVLDDPTVTSSTIRLNWNQSAAADFDHYEILHWTGDPSTATVIASFSHAEQTSHTMAVPEHDTNRHFFKVRVYDKGLEANPSLSSDSNIVSAKVL